MRRGHALVVAVMLALLCLAPTPGDVGGCGTEPTALDPVVFALARKGEDCQRCGECGLSAPRCQRACGSTKPPDTNFPETCRPLRHDGEVCLRALHVASCEAYLTYVDEIAPATPIECKFCQEVPPPGTLPGFTVEAGAVDAGDDGALTL